VENNILSGDSPSLNNFGTFGLGNQTAAAVFASRSDEEVLAKKHPGGQQRTAKGWIAADSSARS
jgi:hypothetical protein